MSDLKDVQSGAADVAEKNLSAADSGNRKNFDYAGEIASLRKEAAKYRVAAREEAELKTVLESQLNEAKQQLADLRKQTRDKDFIVRLDKAGCLKSRLVLNEIPDDCENPDDFIARYKKENPFLFGKEKFKHGYSFKGPKARNYTASQQMNNLIRSALGR